MAGHRAIARFASRECQVRSLRKNGSRGRAYVGRRGLTSQLSFRVTPETHDAITQAAAWAGLSMNEWMNELLEDTFSLEDAS